MLHLGRYILRSGKVQKLPHQHSHAFIFVLNILKPLVVANLPDQKLCAGADHGNRSFQFVTGIGNKLPLLLIAFFQRRNDLLCKEPRKEEKHHQGNPAEDQGVSE